MDRATRARLRAAAPVLAQWVAGAHVASQWRHEVEATAAHHVQALVDATLTVERLGAPGWEVIALTRPGAAAIHAALVQRAALPRLRPGEEAQLVDLVTRVGPALARVPEVTTWRRFFRSPSSRRAAEGAVADLLHVHDRGVGTGLPGRLLDLAPPVEPAVAEAVTPADLVDPRWGLIPSLAALGGRARPGRTEVVATAGYGELPRALADLRAAVDFEAPQRARVEVAIDAIRRPWVAERLAASGLEELRKASTERLRPDLLEADGITTVAQVLAGRRSDLTAISGIGARTADALLDAAREVERVTNDIAPVRLDPEHRTAEATELIAALVAWDAVRVTRGAADDLARAEALRPLAGALHDAVTHLVVTPLGEWRAADLEAETAAVVRRGEDVAARLADRTHASNAEGDPSAGTADPWSELARRPADFYTALAECGVGTEQRSLGDLPAGLVQTVLAQELRTDDLRVTLRNYQAFAARFALVQRRVVIGDEMGLGKTIEALAVMAHLWSTGADRFLVVCPASVVTNWVREVTAKSTVAVHRVHGPGADAAFDAWRREGGVAVISFASLGWRDRDFGRIERLDCVVVDEAHFVKNPDTWRARATLAQVEKADRALLLTGTPMENSVEEFRTLLGYLRPDLVVDSEDMAPWPFRQRVAPAYLRRNVEDVLTELPELVEVDDWLEMSTADRSAYEAAVLEGNFAAMRRAAMLQGAGSAKVARLVELVEEAEDNGRRVVVFSYFRDVLDALADALTGERVQPVFGPLTGSIDPDARQRMIDDFSAAEEGAVLLAQITTGGVGVNIQAASVVIICEPQLKPTTESQAISRSHRMGQLRSVQVHRLLSEDSVDERITEILAAKRRAFDEYVRHSEMADAVPEALDVTDAELARSVVAAEQERLLYRPPHVVAPDD